MSGTPNTPQCNADRANPLSSWDTNWRYVNWPQSTEFTAPMRFAPYSRSTLASAILTAEKAGHHIRAVGSTWSMSDAAKPTDNADPTAFGALIDTSALNFNLQNELSSILSPGVDPTFLFYVGAGVTVSSVYQMLDAVQGRQALNSGGASGQALGGAISTATHGGDSLAPPLCDYVCAIHLFGAGGIEYWIERDSPITDPVKLQVAYPCLARGNIHYNTILFNAVVVSSGSMGIIYSVILMTVPQFGLAQHRVATTWETISNLLGENFLSVLDGSFIQSMTGTVNILDGTTIGASPNPFEPNRFSQIVINPYAFQSDDASLSTSEQSHIGEHLCLVTNRATVQIPTNPTSVPQVTLNPTDLGHAARNAQGSNFLDYDLRWLNFQQSLGGITDINIEASMLLSFLESSGSIAGIVGPDPLGGWGPRTISAMINYALPQLMPLADQLAVSYGMGDAESWTASLKSLCVEAAFSLTDAVTYVQQVLALVQTYAAQTPPTYVLGYLSLRFVGVQTAALLGMQRWSPTCCVEYALLNTSAEIFAFVQDLEKLALANHGALHWGMNNEVMGAQDVINTYGLANVLAFRRARWMFSQNGKFATFDNSFTYRLALQPLSPDISYLTPLLLT